MRDFILNIHSQISVPENAEIFQAEPVKRAIMRFSRDMRMALEDAAMECGNMRCRDEECGDAERENMECGNIWLVLRDMEEEHYSIEVRERRMVIAAGSELGFIYAMNRISESYMGILPFWFWNDQPIRKKAYVRIPEGVYVQREKTVRFRGWFINDEVLISHWDAGKSREYPWEMVFEALLRLGGNLVIPGTDKNSREYAKLAWDMGLWVTHHHAEPLGAEMFARAYPELTPSFQEHPDLFRKLWQEGIDKQKGRKVIWNIGFRGQGDTPFWSSDPSCDTPEKRGELISGIMREQYDTVQSQIPDAVFCTNLYGEMMELYQEGLLRIPEEVIMIWADNGYGRMVTRRRGNHNPRVVSMPPQSLKDKNHGVYYHVSFYDLQAANHITMLPNSMEFVEEELRAAYEGGIRKLWVINASNIKPHTFPLDFTANLWYSDSLDAAEHRRRYVEEYYPGKEPVQRKMEQCLDRYFKSTVSFGTNRDEHAGEQFYNYVTRDFVHNWMKDGGHEPCTQLFWCTGEIEFPEQISWYQARCEAGSAGFAALLRECGEAEAGASLEMRELWEDSVMLQVKIHALCLEGAVLFCQGYQEYSNGKLLEAFYLLGEAAVCYEGADQAMRGREHGKWRDFYGNDCLTDIKETAYCIRRLMGYVRNLGDGPDFYRWQREVIYSEEDKSVVLITNMENHMTDLELFEAMKKRNLSGFAEMAVLKTAPL